MEEKQKVKIGTRGSELALAQTDLVIHELQRKYPDIEAVKVIIRTKGDRILNQPLVDFGGKGVFVTEIEEALRKKTIDLAVHSAKDMPMEIGNNLEISGVLPREDARDVLVTLKDTEIDRMTKPVMRTGSLRRQLQVKKLYHGAECRNIRGNVPTRLQKLFEEECDGVILAAAGLKRLSLLSDSRYSYRFFDYDEMIPSGGQGIIAIEGRQNDSFSKLVRSISDEKTCLELEIERLILRQLGAGCHEAVGVISEIQIQQVEIRIMWEQKGKVLRIRGKAPLEQRYVLVEKLVRQVKAGETEWEKYI